MKIVAVKDLRELARSGAAVSVTGIVLMFAVVGSVYVRGHVPTPFGPSTPMERMIPPFRTVAPLPNTSSYPADAPPLRITEVYLGKSGIWAELYCARGPVSLADYQLSDLDGSKLPLVNVRTTLKTGEFAVVHWGKGINESDDIGDVNRNGVRDIFVGSRSDKGQPYDVAPSRNIDQLALIRNTELGEKMEDAVAWTLPGRAPEQWEADDYNSLVAQNLWIGPSLEVSSIEGASWALRDITAKSGASTWALAAVSTPGMGTEAANIPPVGALTLTEVHPMADKKEAFAEIHCERTAPAEGVNIRAFVVTNLAGQASPLASHDLTLKPGEYAVVHWGEEGITEIDNFGDRNGNGYRDIYLAAGEASARTQDILVLALGGQIYDAVSWQERGRAMTDGFSKKLSLLREREFALTPFELTGPQTLLGRADNNWFVTSIPTPGGSSRLVSAPPKGSVVLTEVYPEGAASWVELEATDKALREGVDVSLFVLSHLDGRAEPLAHDPLTLKTGERVLVHWSGGQTEVDAIGDINGNGVRDVYLSRSNPPAGTTDELALIFGTEIHDAFSWIAPNAKITKPEQEDIAALAAAGFRESPITRENGYSVGRLDKRITTFADPTPGMPNDHYLSRPFGQVRIGAFQVSHEASWVEVECLKGPTDISRLIVSHLDGKDKSISEKPITLQKSERAHIVWAKGASETDDIGDANHNGVRDIFIDQDAPKKSGDEIVLIHNGRMLDAVVFSDWENARFQYPEQKDVKKLVEKGLWHAADVARPEAVVTGGAVCKRAARTWTAG